MSKVKRIVALVLVLVLMVAFASMVVSARATCSYCGSGDTITYPYNSTYTTSVYSCAYHNGIHTHTITEYYYRVICRSCGATYNGSPYNTIVKCPFN